LDAGRDAIKESAAAMRQALNVTAPAGV
jgi:hypothetical protein